MTTDTQICRVYVDGIWDLFHAGHINLFKQARAKAESLFPGKEVQLLVGVCDEGVAAYKRETIMDLEERSAAVRAHALAHKVISNCPLIITEDFLEKHQIDLVVHGDDFTEAKKQKYYGAALNVNKFATVPYTPGVSTTELITHAKCNGELKSSNHTLLADDEIVARIKARSWESMGIEPPTQ